MIVALKILAWLIALSWLWKAVTAAMGLPRIPNLLGAAFDRSPEGEPSVSVIIPARNEASHVQVCLESLLAQDYANLKILAVDDRSTDQTRTMMDDLACRHPEKLRVLYVTQLPEGWLGKTHAMVLAARHAISLHRPDYLLFTDADVIFASQAIRRSLAQAVATSADHFVVFPTPILKSAGEGMFLGYLGVMGMWAIRPWRAENPRAIRDSIGVGAFNLVRTSAYQQLGGFDALRMEIVEDLALGRRVKLAGLRQRVVAAPGMVSLHWAAGTLGVVDAMTKNLFAVLRFRAEFVLLSCLWLILFCLAPLGFLALDGTRFPAMLIFAAIAVLYVLCSRHSRISPWYAVFFPLSALIFIYSILRSTLITLRQGGVIWRGTFYALAELRKNASPL